MTTETRLSKFEVENLDLYEYQKYNAGIDIGLSKIEALQMIIDGCNGNFESLSESLSEIAEEQSNEI
jgi:hypothetical protein